MNHKFPYRWNLSDGYPATGIEKNNFNVFGTFICGGGSTLGYKLAGFSHLGGVEIDKQVADIYETNHKPKYLFNEDIRDFNKRIDLPRELYELDILDGSPPCSTFSMAGSREKAWGKSKKFREGQENQTLDDLVFVYCDTIIKLQPKVFLLENVKGIIQGNAKLYSKKIVEKMTNAGYTVQVFCSNAASMGVPQKRERVFFIGFKNEFKFPKLKLEFNEKAITFGEYCNDKHEQMRIGKMYNELFIHRIKEDKSFADICVRVQKRNAMWNSYIIDKNDTFPTILAGSHYYTWDMCGKIESNEYCCIGSYPLDYNFKLIEPKYLIGMSVPPVMAAQISHQIFLQWLSKLS